MPHSRTVAPPPPPPFHALPGEVQAGVCGRCGRWTHHLESWLERRRLRLPAPVPGGHAYRHRIVEHLVCPPCHGEVRRGRPVQRSPALALSALAIVATLGVAALLPLAMPSLLAAFWSNGAAPLGWRAGHAGGRAPFLPGQP